MQKGILWFMLRCSWALVRALKSGKKIGKKVKNLADTEVVEGFHRVIDNQ